METNLTKWIERSVKDEAIVVFEPDRIKIGVELGAGAFSKVHRAELVIGVNPTIVAVKIFKNSSELQVDEKTQSELIKEIRLLRTVGFSPHILNFHGISKVPNTDTYMLILEYADGGSLRDYLKSRELAGHEKIRLAKEIVSGVACLHDSDIIHRDLNSANILVHQHHVKIADLGLSKKAAGSDTVKEATSKVHGHLQYIDPQCFKNINYKRTRKSDIYSVGVVFWELSSARIPFPDLSSTQAIAYIINGVREEPVDGTPQEFIDLYTKCWDQEPENRPEIKKVYEKLEEIRWDTEATSTGSVSSSNESTEISTTISQKLSEIQIVKSKGVPEEATVLLKQFFDSGKEADDISGYIRDYLKEKDKKPEELFEMLMRECNVADEDVINHPHALLFGFCYYKEIGIKANHGRAFDIFQKLAAGESPNRVYAQYFLGECFHSGFGVNPDREMAFFWYKESAEGGTSNGQYEVADCYRYGFGTDKDIEEAKRWYRKAADKKHFLALNALNDEAWQNER